jgi:hypothetical protein
MENLKFEITQDKLQEAVNNAIEASFKSEYSNPVRKAVDTELSEIDGSIRTLIKEMMNKAINDPQFKEAMQKVVIEKLVEKAMKS